MGNNKKRYQINWTNIYSLGLAPAILIWGLAPSLHEYVTIPAAIVIGVLWIIFSYRQIQCPDGCGIIGWTTGWAMTLGGIVEALLVLLDCRAVPIVLFLAPCMTLLLYLFRHRNIQPSFCHQCILKRGGIRERHLLGDFSRYETHYILRLILIGGILITVLSWTLFLCGVGKSSRTGEYFYYYFPLGLCIAIIIFEFIRRILILQLVKNHERKRNSNMDYFFTVIRIMIIGQGKIYLIENKGDEFEFNSGKGLDVPIHRYTDYCTTLAEEKLKAQQIVQEERGINAPDLHHISSAVSNELWRRVGLYVLFIPDEEIDKLSQYGGRWYTAEEVTRLFHKHKLYPLFKESYSRFYTIVTTAKTYYSNGTRRYMKGYKPSFSFHKLDTLGIEFDDPLWLYISRHNEDQLLYRIHKWINKIRSKKNSSNA